MTTPGHDRLSVLVERIIFQQGFATILSGRAVHDGADFGVHGDHGRIVVRAKRSAYVTPPVPGETWEISGRWVQTAGFGLQFDATRATRSRPHGRLIVPFIAARVDGIGPTRAARLWEKLAGSLDDVLASRDVDALAAVLAPTQPALSRRLAEDLLRAWDRLEREGAVLQWLQEQGIDDVRSAERILEVLGGRAIEVLESNPYALVSLLPWRRIDALGQRLLSQGKPDSDARSDARRLVGAADSVVRDLVTGGDTMIDTAGLRPALAKKLGVTERSRLVERCIRLAERNSAIIRTDAGWRAPGCALLESELATGLQELASHRACMRWDPARGEPHLAPLSFEQRAAALKVLRSPLAILAGGAGTGKTTTIRAICDAWEASGGNVALSAFSGKAAVVLSKKASTSGRPRQAITLFRLLKELDSAGSGQGGTCPVSVDSRTLVIVDEASMVDLGQWHRLLERLPLGCRLLMVGDPAQLPPIGMGIVFHHLCEVDAIVAKLVTVHRQAEGSGIPAVAAEIRAGRAPVLPTFSGPAENVSFLQVAEDRMQEAVQQVVADLGGFVRGRHSLQIICPLNDRHPASVRVLNAMFQKVYRSGGFDVVSGYRGQSFTVGDPVLYLRNDFRAGLCNGSLGYVLEADESRCSLVVDFDGERHELAGEQLSDVDLAYALTCHKAQGSQSESVIVPLYKSRLLDPSWIYTAVTRAERQVVLVGDRAIFTAALGELPAWRRRRTGFALHLRGLAFGDARR